VCINVLQKQNPGNKLIEPGILIQKKTAKIRLPKNTKPAGSVWHNVNNKGNDQDLAPGTKTRTSSADSSASSDKLLFSPAQDMDTAESPVYPSVSNAL